MRATKETNVVFDDRMNKRRMGGKGACSGSEACLGGTMTWIDSHIYIVIYCLCMYNEAMKMEKQAVISSLYTIYMTKKPWVAEFNLEVSSAVGVL